MRGERGAFRVRGVEAGSRHEAKATNARIYYTTTESCEIAGEQETLFISWLLAKAERRQECGERTRRGPG